MVQPGFGGRSGPPEPVYDFCQHAEISGPSVQAVVKVGDTVSDIQEGRNAGVRSLGVLEGSSMMGMTQAAYEALSADEKQAALDRARQVFLEAGADDVLLNIEQLPAWIQAND